MCRIRKPFMKEVRYDTRILNELTYEACRLKHLSVKSAEKEILKLWLIHRFDDFSISSKRFDLFIDELCYMRMQRWDGFYAPLGINKFLKFAEFKQLSVDCESSKFDTYFIVLALSDYFGSNDSDSLLKLGIILGKLKDNCYSWKNIMGYKRSVAFKNRHDALMMLTKNTEDFVARIEHLDDSSDHKVMADIASVFGFFCENEDLLGTMRYAPENDILPSL